MSALHSVCCNELGWLNFVKKIWPHTDMSLENIKGAISDHCGYALTLQQNSTCGDFLQINCMESESLSVIFFCMRYIKFH